MSKSLDFPEGQFEKTKPISRKGKSKKAKGKMRVNPELLRRCYLKKQSQYHKGQINVNIEYIKCYDRFSSLRVRKNKANQSQFRTPALTKGVEKEKFVPFTHSNRM
ncbi:hypothetical protein ACFL3Q_16855 [Planctomycetota bacterium]